MRWALLTLIRLYQRGISPSLPPSCKYQPTCSEYGYEAIRRFGAFRGSVLTVWRLVRCNPLSRGGYDPVPGGTMQGDAAAHS